MISSGQHLILEIATAHTYRLVVDVGARSWSTRASFCVRRARAAPRRVRDTPACSSLVSFSRVLSNVHLLYYCSRAPLTLVAQHAHRCSCATQFGPTVSLCGSSSRSATAPTRAFARAICPSCSRKVRTVDCSFRCSWLFLAAVDTRFTARHEYENYPSHQ